MSYIRTKLQIPGILLLQSKKPKKMLGFNERCLNLIPSSDLRSFWSWGRGKSKSKTTSDCPRTKCGKPLPERPKLCNPECVSKCLQMKHCDKVILKEKLSNCREPKIVKPKSYWEKIFGGKTENSPDPCICRRVHRERQIAREKDSRLCDSRYEATAGDVLIFTEAPTPKVRKPLEPQPQPPPPYKLPKAVLTKNMTEQASMGPYTCAGELQFSPSCGSPKCSVQSKPSTLPYDEMRPPIRQIKDFSCKYGIQPEDVAPPIRRDCNNCLSKKSADSSNPEDYPEQSAKFSNDWKSLESNSDECSLQNTRKYSRIEQLKLQTRAKQDSKYSEFLMSSFKKVSQCRSPCCPPSCKMSTFTTSTGTVFKDHSNWSGIGRPV